jgi:hypothetical protein
MVTADFAIQGSCRAVRRMAGGELRRQTMKETINKLTVFLTCLSVSLCIALGITAHWLQEARQTVDRQERQLKELYGQVNELTLQYVEIVKRVQNHK